MEVENVSISGEKLEVLSPPAASVFVGEKYDSQRKDGPWSGGANRCSKLIKYMSLTSQLVALL